MRGDADHFRSPQANPRHTSGQVAEVALAGADAHPGSGVVRTMQVTDRLMLAKPLRRRLGLVAMLPSIYLRLYDRVYEDHD